MRDVQVFDRQRKEGRAFLGRWMEMCQDAELGKDRDYLEDGGKFCGRCWACLPHFHSPIVPCSTLYYPQCCFYGLCYPDLHEARFAHERPGQTLQTRRQAEHRAFVPDSLACGTAPVCGYVFWSTSARQFWSLVPFFSHQSPNPSMLGVLHLLTSELFIIPCSVPQLYDFLCKQPLKLNSLPPTLKKSLSYQTSIFMLRH